MHMYIYEVTYMMKRRKKNIIIDGSLGPFWTIMSLSRVAAGQLRERRGQIMLLHHIVI